MKSPEILSALFPVVRFFQSHRVPYYIGGSLASSAFGKARSTIDADLVADLPATLVDGMVAAFRDTYYIDGDMIRSAIEHHSCFNLIHLETMFKLDIFIFKGAEYDRQVLARIQKEKIESESESGELCFASPEDIILHKLLWYRLGKQVSQRQWEDALGVLRVQYGKLDMDYLEQWAGELGVAEYFLNLKAQR